MAEAHETRQVGDSLAVLEDFGRHAIAFYGHINQQLNLSTLDGNPRLTLAGVHTACPMGRCNSTSIWIPKSDIMQNGVMEKIQKKRTLTAMLQNIQSIVKLDGSRVAVQIAVDQRQHSTHRDFFPLNS